MMEELEEELSVRGDGVVGDPRDNHVEKTRAGACILIPFSSTGKFVNFLRKVHRCRLFTLTIVSPFLKVAEQVPATKSLMLHVPIVRGVGPYRKIPKLTV